MTTLAFLDPPKSSVQQEQENVREARRPFTRGQKIALFGIVGMASVAATVLLMVMSAVLLIAVVIYQKYEHDQALDAAAAKAASFDPAGRRGDGPTGASTDSDIGSAYAPMVVPTIQIDDRPLPLPPR